MPIPEPIWKRRLTLGKHLDPPSAVIPAQAGIQWFNHDMLARAGMTMPVLSLQV